MALGWGILATGGIAHAFTKDLLVAGLDVTAVGSRTQESAERFARPYGIPNAHGSYEDLVADPSVDIVYVATPHPQHAAAATLALEAGKHVLIEKPLTLNAREAQAVRDLAAERGLLAMEAMWTRYLPHMVRIREILREGALGDLRMVTATHAQSAPIDPTHRLNALDLGGGALLDLGVYPVSFAWDICGRPETVSATARLGETGADTDVVAVMTHTGGVISTSISSSRTAGLNTGTILGTEGRIDIDDYWLAPTTFRVIARDGTEIERFDAEVEGRGMQFQALAAERVIAEGSGAPEELPIDESVAIMATLDEVRRQIGLTYPGDA